MYIVIKLFAKLKKKTNIVINYWEYLVPNIVINYVITTYWEYLFFFFSVSIVINNMLGLKKNFNIVINNWEYLVLNIMINC